MRDPYIDRAPPGSRAPCNPAPLGPSTSTGAAMSYLRQLVQSTLRPTKRAASMMHPELEVGLFGQASVTGARAVAYGGAGLDLACGECLLAGIGSHQSERGFEHRLAAAITNRRTIVGGWSSVKGVLNDVRAWVMHDEVLGLDAKTGLVSAKFDVHTPRGPVELVHLGQPMSYQSPQPGLHWLDFRLDPRRDAIGGALKALGIASFIGLGIGFSPGGMIAAEIMKKQPVHAIRFVYADAPGGCAYEMHANGRRLEHGEAEMAHAIHQLLLHAAWPVLERRCHVGWGQAYAQLFAHTAHG